MCASFEILDFFPVGQHFYFLFVMFFFNIKKDYYHYIRWIDNEEIDDDDEIKVIFYSGRCPFL